MKWKFFTAHPTCSTILVEFTDWKFLQEWPLTECFQHCIEAKVKLWVYVTRKWFVVQHPPGTQHEKKWCMIILFPAAKARGSYLRVHFKVCKEEHYKHSTLVVLGPVHKFCKLCFNSKTKQLALLHCVWTLFFYSGKNIFVNLQDFWTGLSSKKYEIFQFIFLCKLILHEIVHDIYS